MIVSKKIGDVYFFNKIYAVNKALTWPAYFDHNFSDSTIQASGGPYEVIISIYHILATQNTGIAPQVLQVQVLKLYLLNPEIYTIRVNSNGIYLYSIGVQGFIISKSLVNNDKLKNIILYHHYGSSLSASTSGSIYSYPGVSLTITNTFFGLFYYKTNNNNIYFIMTFTLTQFS